MAKSEDEIYVNTARVLRRYYKNWKQDEPPFGVLRMLMRQVEPAAIVSTLEYTKGNKSRAAHILGINRRTLDTKLDIYRIKV